MSTQNARRLWTILFAFACVAPAVAAQQPPSPAQELEMDIGVLNKLRADPQAKSFILARRKEVLTRRGVTDPDARLAEIRKIFDEAVAMSDADFEKNLQHLANRIMVQMQPGDASRPTRGQTYSPVNNPAKAIPWIEVHDHFSPTFGRDPSSERDYHRAVATALATMDKVGISKTILMPPPAAGERARMVDCDGFLAALKPHPTRFAFLGGGLMLNAVIQQTAKQTTIGDALRREFEKRAEKIVNLGAVGFGEMAAHHLSLEAGHVYESVPADHPLFLLLADIAAKHDVPIDIHFDVVTKELPRPEWLTSPLNPRVFQPNVAAFERLLAHNRKAKICWAHAGSDNTGHWTTELSRRLLQAHPNLYMSLRVGLCHPPENAPLASPREIRPDWLQLFQDFPDRFVIGNDRFFVHEEKISDEIPKGALLRTQFLLNALPPSFARKIASENAIALYKLKN